MHPNQRPASLQQRSVRHHRCSSALMSYCRSIVSGCFRRPKPCRCSLAQALSSGGSCRQAVNDAAVKGNRKKQGQEKNRRKNQGQV